MATQILGRGFSSNGSSTVNWQVDYDTVGQTIGHTCTGQASQLIIVVTLIADPNNPVISKNVTPDLGKGRVVDRSNVPQSAIPVVAKGQAAPYTISANWAS